MLLEVRIWRLDAPLLGSKLQTVNPRNGLLGAEQKLVLLLRDKVVQWKELSLLKGSEHFRYFQN